MKFFATGVVAVCLGASAYAQQNIPGSNVPPNTPGYTMGKSEDAAERRKQAKPKGQVRPEGGDAAKSVEISGVPNDRGANSAQKRVQSTRRARELAQSTLDSEVKRLRAGASTTFFVAQQQETLSFAEIREASAQADYARALAEYDRQLGVTLEKLNITIDPPK